MVTDGRIWYRVGPLIAYLGDRYEKQEFNQLSCRKGYKMKYIEDGHWTKLTKGPEILGVFHEFGPGRVHELIPV